MKKPKNFEKNRLMINATSILVALFLVLTSAVSAIQIDSQTEPYIEPALASDTVRLSAASDSSGQSPQRNSFVDYLGYNDGHTENAYKWTDGSPWTLAIELSDPELVPYRTYELTEVYFSCGCDDYGFYAEDYEVYYETGSLPDISTVTPIASGTASDTGWTSAPVPAQPMPASGSAFVIIRYTTAVGYPAGFDYDNGDIRGQHMLNHQTTNDWIHLQDLWGSPAVWGLDAGLEPGGPPEEHDVGVTDIITPVSGSAGVKTPKVEVRNFGNNSEEDVPVQMTISKVNPPQCGWTYGFEDWTSPSYGTPPPGWYMYESIPGDLYDNYWEGFDEYDYAYPSLDPYNGTYCAFYDCGANYPNGGASTLVTPEIDFSGVTGTMIDLFGWFHKRGYGGTSQNGFVDIDYSTDNVTFTNAGTIELYDSSQYYGYWVDDSVDISALAGETTAYFAFEANDVGYSDIAMDELSLSYCGLTQEYQETELVDVPFNESVEVTFDDWTPDDWQVSENIALDYVLEAETQLVGDNDTGNDYKTETITLTYPYLHDVTVIDLEPSEDGPGEPQEVSATIKNIGQFSECCFKTRVKIGEKTGIFINEEFEGDFPPSGWTVVELGTAGGVWKKNTDWGRTNYMGTGDCADADSDAFGSGKTMETDLITPSFDLSSQSTATLEFDAAYNAISSGEEFSVHVSTDGGSTWTELLFWNSDHSAYGPGEHVELDLTTFCGNSDVQIKFHYDDNGIWAWWCEIDNVYVAGEMGIIEEYNEEVCIPSGLFIEPGETLDLEFPDWTPDAIEDGESGFVFYSVIGQTELLDDSNPGNDQMVNDITLEYWHDVRITDFASPADRGDVWLKYHTGFNDNGVGLTSGGTIYWAMRLTPDELGPYDTYVIDEFKMMKYGAYANSGNWRIYAGGTATTPGTLVTEGTWSTSGQEEVLITLDDPYQIDASEDLWVDWDCTHTAGQYPAGVDAGPAVAGKGDLVSFDGATYAPLSGYGLNYNWVIEAHLSIGGGGPGNADIFIQPSVKSIDMVIDNDGTFDETGLTLYGTVIEYITDPNGTIADEFNKTGISLDIDEEKTENLGSFDFAVEGMYEITTIMPLGIDDYPNNNALDLVIGCDDTPPVSDPQELDPPTPDGLAGWYVSDCTVTINADDGEEPYQSGVDRIEYRIDGGAWQSIPNGGSFDITTDGQHTIDYRAVDNVENVEDFHTFNIDMDQTAPTIDMVWELLSQVENQILFTANCNDAMSGMDYVEFQFNDVQQHVDDAEPYEWIMNWAQGLKGTIKAIAFDVAGNNDFDTIHTSEGFSNEVAQITPHSQPQPRNN